MPSEMPVHAVLTQLIATAAQQSKISREKRLAIELALDEKIQNRLASEALQASMNATEALCKIVELLALVLEGAVNLGITVAAPPPDLHATANGKSA